MNKEFVRQRIAIFCGTDIDPSIDSQVAEILPRKFNIALPQRASLDDALEASISDHEIISLIIKYRSLNRKERTEKYVYSRKLTDI